MRFRRRNPLRRREIPWIPIGIFLFLIILSIAFPIHNARRQELFTQVAMQQQVDWTEDREELRRFLRDVKDVTIAYYDQFGENGVGESRAREIFLRARQRVAQRLAAARGEPIPTVEPPVVVTVAPNEPTQPPPPPPPAPEQIVVNPLEGDNIYSNALMMVLYDKFVSDYQGFNQAFDGPAYGIQCVGGVKFWMRDGLGIRPQVWAPATNSYMGWPPIAVWDWMNGRGGIIDPTGTANIGGHQIAYKVLELKPEHWQYLIPGDIMILGKTGGPIPPGGQSAEVGHTGIFNGFANGTPDSGSFVMFDMNGERGASDPSADYFRFHTFSQGRLNEHIIAFRVVFENVTPEIIADIERNL